MKKKSTPQPTITELEVLKILWRNGPATVKLVNKKMNEIKEVGYTTTLKIMQIMAEKKMLSRDTDGRSHVYTPTFKEEEIQHLLLDKLLNSAFGGSAMKLVMQALGNYNTSKEELNEIKELIDKMENKEN